MQLLFILPFLIWLFFVRHFYSHGLTVIADAQHYFLQGKFYLTNVFRGVYPFWTPFDLWGRPGNLLARFMGEFNPLYYLMGLTYKLGIPYSFTYYLYMVTYFLLGACAFYLLVGRLYGDRRLSYLALLLFLFSSTGFNLFSDTTVIFILMPCIYFFYFLVAFLQTWQHKYLFGLVFAMMLIATTYMPFYFLSLLIALFGFFLLLYPKMFISYVKKIAIYICRNKCVVLICIFSVLVALIPGITWYLDGSQTDYALSWRQNISGDTHASHLSLDTINRSGIIGHASLDELLSGLQLFEGYTFYAPFIVYIILLFGVTTRLNRRMILYLGTSLSLFFIMLCDITPVHKFLYDHVGYFKLFRNLHFFVGFAYTVFILFIVEIFKEILTWKFNRPSKATIYTTYVLLIHIGLFILLLNLESIIISTYINLACSALFFLLLAFSPIRSKPNWLMFALLLAVTIQPVETFNYAVKNNKGRRFTHANDHLIDRKYRPQFSYLRPSRKEDDGKHLLGAADAGDNSGYADNRYFYGLKDTYDVQMNDNAALIENYGRHKFALYDQFPGEGMSGLLQGKMKFVTTDSDEFSVTGFDLNSISIQTNFKNQKYLVYNDSYHSKWRAEINKNPVIIDKANLAFKGITIPAGKNDITMQFGSNMEHRLFWCVIFYFQAFFIFIVIRFLKNQKAMVYEK